jgi:hypothetical protein
MGLADFFRATEAELRAAYPGWKLPLADPNRRQGTNPFTKQPVEILSWDPNPDEVVEERGPSRPPGPSIDCKGLGPTSVASLIAIVHDASNEVRERFYRPALIGPEDEHTIHELPSALVTNLAALDESARGRIAHEWATRERADLATIRDRATRDMMLARRDFAYWRAMVDELAGFAQAAVADGRSVYMWLST